CLPTSSRTPSAIRQRERASTSPCRRAANVTSPSSPTAGRMRIDECENVFRRLYRLERERATPGSGLGLSLVAAIAELHGAAVNLADNAPGLRVEVSFPRA